MSYPAYDQLGQHIGLGFAQWRVYMYLRPPRLNFKTPTEVKVWSIAHDLRMSERHVRSALDWLVSQGYLEDCGRGTRRVRTFVLAYINDKQPDRPAA